MSPRPSSGVSELNAERAAAKAVTRRRQQAAAEANRREVEAIRGEQARLKREAAERRARRAAR